MDRIKLRGIKVYARHGCLDEEGVIGSMYRVDMCVKTDLTRAAETDSIQYAPDYVILNRIVHEEMAIRSLLLEHVTGRIADRVLKEFPEIAKVKVSVAKINPPVQGNIADIRIIISRKQKKV